MKVIIFSDSHGKKENMINSINMFKDEIDAIIHLGDYIEDTKEIEKNFPEKKLFKVSGNNDYSTIAYEKIIELNGYKLFIAHGHEYRVNFGIENLYYRGKELDVDIALYGHTHTPFVENNEILIINPGSISSPRGFDFCTFAILDLSEEIDYKFYMVNNDSIKQIRI